MWDDDRGEVLRSFFWASSREDQLIIEKLVDDRGITDLAEIKALLDESSSESLSLSSGTL